ncbi:MAG TPA: hypothetical protein VLZ83_04400 [Edaphocola sp.]|jgi:hypothetical protein|nr:hypothetical protein [Edaphocola sp.]
MYHKTIFHTLSDGTKAKFTIRDRIIDGDRYFYANIINPELDFYKAMSQIEQENYFGMEITNGRQQSINYRDSNRLINDILTKYGDEWLETEK